MSAALGQTASFTWNLYIARAFQRRWIEWIGWKKKKRKNNFSFNFFYWNFNRVKWAFKTERQTPIVSNFDIHTNFSRLNFVQLLTIRIKLEELLRIIWDYHCLNIPFWSILVLRSNSHSNLSRHLQLPTDCDTVVRAVSILLNTKMLIIRSNIFELTFSHKTPISVLPSLYLYFIRRFTRQFWNSLIRADIFIEWEPCKMCSRCSFKRHGNAGRERHPARNTCCNAVTIVIC